MKYTAIAEDTSRAVWIDRSVLKSVTTASRTISAGLVLLFSVSVYCPVSSQDDLIVAGYVERVMLTGQQIEFEAKLDTGAKSSSINAPGYQIITRNGKRLAQFELKNHKGQLAKFERPIVRTVRIRRAGTPIDERPTVLLQVCILGHRVKTEFNLADRSELNYPILIGRSLLAGRIVVDSGRTHTARKPCSHSSEDTIDR